MLKMIESAVTRTIHTLLMVTQRNLKGIGQYIKYLEILKNPTGFVPLHPFYTSHQTYPFTAYNS